ncbi:MAG: glycosyltransferase family 9 protein [Bacteroidetes bacterium]|nr:MAG: glycosyltransferase family 9 protein [Bacteroidota bacterium]
MAKSTTKKRKADGRRTAATKRRTAARPFTVPECKRFTGYKPCFPGTACYRECVEHRPIGKRILIVNLDAMGAVVQTTAMLPAIKRKYPDSHITWITLKNAYRLLDNNPYLDAVYVWEPESWLILQQMEFDILYQTDKTKRSCAFGNTIRAAEKLGFGLDGNGKIVPLNREAEYSYILGLDDELKFRKNRKYGTEILQEALKLEFRRDEYVLQLSDEEQRYVEAYKRDQRLDGGELIVGFNTGCSYLYPNKKMTIDQHVELIERLSGTEGVRLVLVGGPEDTERNAEIVRRVGEKVVSTPTTEGVRRGICYEAVCDVVITGDSFGMHVAIGLKKHVIAWFGLSCWSEIDLYDRGMMLVPEGLHCAPCWKRSCPYGLECISMIDLERIAGEVKRLAAIRAKVF